MFNTNRWDMAQESMGTLAVGSIESQRYSQGLTIIKTLFNFLDSVFTTQTKYLRSTPLTLAMLQNSLKKGLTQDEWEKWVIGLAEKKNIFMRIVGKTQGDFEQILIDIANKTETSGLTTRANVDSHFMNNDYYKQSFAEKTYAAAKVVKSSAEGAGKSIVGGVDFLGNTKYFLLAGALGFLAYKLLGESDKVSKAYSTIKGDAGKLYEKAKGEAGKLYEKTKADLKRNPQKKKGKNSRKFLTGKIIQDNAIKHDKSGKIYYKRNMGKFLYPKNTRVYFIVSAKNDNVTYITRID